MYHIKLDILGISQLGKDLVKIDDMNPFYMARTPDWVYVGLM